jgi:hypothetical protein
MHPEELMKPDLLSERRRRDALRTTASMLPAAQRECGIHPCKEIAGAAQADATDGGAVLARMVSDNHRQVISALRGPRIAENRAHSPAWFSFT